MHDIIHRLRTRKGDEGFTLIELLVVVVIIGVLVAIAVPVYLNYRKGAADKSAQSDVRGAVSTIEQFYTDNNNTYPGSTGTGCQKVGSSFQLTSTTCTVPSPVPATAPAGWVVVSDKSQITYVNNGTSYLVCGTNTGGSTVGSSTKVYLYDSSKGGSVAAATVSMTTCA
jgi:type IV pilus assembly protein PilA